MDVNKNKDYTGLNKTGNGFITLHRKFLEWEWYTDINTKTLFLHCLLKANHKDKRYKGDLIKKGSFVTGRDLLSKETGLTVQQVRTALNKLKSTNEITITSTKKGTLINIVKWGDYQSYEQTSNQQNNQDFNQIITNNQPTSNQQVTTNNNDNNDNNSNNLYMPVAFSLKNGADYFLTLEEYNKLKNTYAYDIDPELKKASLWLDSNPSRKKTEKGMFRFISGWLSRNNFAERNPKREAPVPEYETEVNMTDQEEKALREKIKAMLESNHES